MLGLRLLLLILGATLVICLLGYSLSRDRRWLDLLNFTLKASLALAVILGLTFLLARFVLI